MSKEPTIAEMLEEARNARGLSVRAAVKLFPTTETTWRAWQRGQAPGTRWTKSFAKFTGQDKAYVASRIVTAVWK